ncbi:MAG TPA: prepilin-type N-terminal cleavage/methylation domain-containing protein, partial [bacterium]|nr:prepilin-type N-terminal cleavage/methylation domain-containing protein [bacterium]
MLLCLNKKSKYPQNAFTLIELLVVIGIIALLSSLSIIALNSARAKSRDARRLSDVKQISTALEMYYSSNGNYPSLPSPTGTPITNLCLSELGITSTCGLEVYMKKIPADPTKDKHYYYSPLANNLSYQLSYDEETKTDCPDNWIRVPGNLLYGTHSFCVMKYEAKDDGSGNPVSKADGTPWVNITQLNAKAKCEAIGAHLITENEWLSIVRNLELQASNWTGGSIGSGQIPRGNSDSSAAMDGSTELTGVNKRTHTLSNGEVIWDLAGNVWEWT